MAVWDKWIAGRGDLRELLRTNLPDPATVSAEIRAAGATPNIPPEFLHRLGLAACAWGFSTTEVAAFAAAVAAGDEAAMAKMLRQSAGSPSTAWPRSPPRWRARCAPAEFPRWACADAGRPRQR